MKWYKREVVWHIAFWLLYLLSRVFVLQLHPGSLGFRIGMELIEVPLKIFVIYFSIYVLIRKLLLPGKYILFIALFVLSIFVVMWLNRIEDYFIIYPLTHIAYVRYELGFWSIRAAFLNLIYIYPIAGMAATFYFVHSWMENQLAREKLAREKAEIELKSLKEQIHPHFLFNTLNNLYALALAQSAKTPDMMLRLSKLLSYMIYEATATEVSLTKEIQILKDYVELERLRLDDRLEISFHATGATKQARIAPLLLFPLLENCFKHGSHRTSDRIWIRFNLNMQAER
jgi:two-component system, LytTR family, sensor kinase